MASKDYVKRPKAPEKKQATRLNSNKGRNSNKRRNTSKYASTPLPWVKVFVALAVVSLFAFGLYKLQSVSVDDSATEVSPNSDVSISTSTDSVDTVDDVEINDTLEQVALPELPVLGEEEWEYIDSLPDFSVEVDATGPLQSDKDYIMQCGSFRTQDRAEELKAKIAFQGLESRVLTSNGRNGLWYRVVLGPYERKRNAERHRHKLRSGKVNGCKIW